MCTFANKRYNTAVYEHAIICFNRDLPWLVKILALDLNNGIALASGFILSTAFLDHVFHLVWETAHKLCSETSDDTNDKNL